MSLSIPNPEPNIIEAYKVRAEYAEAQLRAAEQRAEELDRLQVEWREKYVMADHERAELQERVEEAVDAMVDAHGELEAANRRRAANQLLRAYERLAALSPKGGKG